MNILNHYKARSSNCNVLPSIKCSFLISNKNDQSNAWEKIMHAWKLHFNETYAAFCISWLWKGSYDCCIYGSVSFNFSSHHTGESLNSLFVRNPTNDSQYHQYQHSSTSRQLQAADVKKATNLVTPILSTITRCECNEQKPFLQQCSVP